jgi:hypothetical protein
MDIFKSQGLLVALRGLAFALKLPDRCVGKALIVALCLAFILIFLTKMASAGFFAGQSIGAEDLAKL